MSRFHREVQLIEDEANIFINESFMNLRSAEAAFDMLNNFKHIHARDSINSTMMKKFTEILSTYEKEVDSINTLFEANKQAPPVSKVHPPVAGTISWCRSLFHRIKHTVLRFQTMKELIDSDAGKAVSVYRTLPPVSIIETAVAMQEITSRCCFLLLQRLANAIWLWHAP